MSHLTITTDEHVRVGLTSGLIKSEQWQLFSDTQSTGERINELHRQAQENADKAHEKGYVDGYRSGSRQAQDQLTSRMLQMEEQYAARLAAQEAHIVDIAIALARKVVNTHFEDSWFIDRVADTIRQAQANAQVRLRVHPDQLAVAEEARRELDMLLPTTARLEITADAALEPADCIVETETGRVVANLDRQLQLLKRLLLEG